ncbi:hypothetical protein MTO96_033697 [Rhipicephalus appendiculatus]
MDETTNDRPMVGAEGIATVQIHLPSFWPQNPAAWFTHVEAIFALRRITSQEEKFSHAVSALSKEAVAEFHDLVGAPHEANPYDHIKTTVLQRNFRNAFNKFMDSDPAITEQLTVDLLDKRIRNQRSSTPFFIVNFLATLSKSPAPFVEVHPSP